MTKDSIDGNIHEILDSISGGEYSTDSQEGDISQLIYDARLQERAFTKDAISEHDRLIVEKVKGLKWRYPDSEGGCGCSGCREVDSRNDGIDRAISLIEGEDK